MELQEESKSPEECNRSVGHSGALASGRRQCCSHPQAKLTLLPTVSSLIRRFQLQFGWVAVGALRNRLGMRQAEVRTGRSTSLRGPRFTLFGLIGEWADCCEASARFQIPALAQTRPTAILGANA